jgi:hypothetical protein
VVAGRSVVPVDNSRDQLDAAAAGAELVELELEPLDEVELDFSDDAELLDSELPVEPFDELDELFAELLAVSRLSLR